LVGTSPFGADLKGVAARIDPSDSCAARPLSGSRQGPDVGIRAMNGWRELLTRERPGNGTKPLGARDDQLRNGLAQLDLLLGTLGLPPERLRLLVNGIGAAGAERKLAVADARALPLAEPQLSFDDWLPWDGRALGRPSRTDVPRTLARRQGAYARAVGRLLDEMFVLVRPSQRSRRLRVAVAVAPVAQEEEEVELPWRNASAR
jgi:hypothetical protein